MPRYYVHSKLGDTLIEDPEGSELPDLTAARDEAIAAARELLATAILNGADLGDRHFVIADDQGTPLLVLPLTAALPRSLRHRLRDA